MVVKIFNNFIYFIFRFVNNILRFVGVYIRSMRVYNIIRIMETVFDEKVMKILEYVGHQKEIRDRKNARMKEYRQRPDQQQIEYDRNHIKIKCDCGGSFTLSSKVKHHKTNKHIKYDVGEQEKQKQIKNEELEKWGNIESLI